MKLGARKRLSAIFGGQSAKIALGLGLTAAAALSTAVLPVGTATAGAATAETGLSSGVSWHAPYPFINISQEFIIDNRASSTFWAAEFSAQKQNNGGYIGVQTDGTVGGEQVSGDAIFSMWNAVAWRQVPGSSATCQRFSKEGTGGSCRAAFSIVAGDTYKVNVSAFGKPTTIGTSTIPVQWWEGKVTDKTAGTSTTLGLIASTATSLTGPSNFVEDLSMVNAAGVQDCGYFPVTETTFFNPSVIVPGGTPTTVGYADSDQDQRVCEPGTIVTGMTYTNKPAVNLIAGGPILS